MVDPLSATRTSDTGDPSILTGDALPTLTAVVSRFPAPSQTFIRRKLEGLRAAGMDVRIASTNFHEGAEASGFPLVSTAPWQHPRDALTARGRREWAAVLRTVAAGRPTTPRRAREQMLRAPLDLLDSDIVHFEFSGIAVTYLDALDDLAGSARLAVSCRGAAEQIEPLKDPRRADALARVFERVDMIHCVSDDMRRTVEALGAPPDRIVINRPAVPVASFAGLRGQPFEREGPLRVLSIGRLHWKKGFDDGLRAIAAVRDRGIDVRYRIAGEGAEREKLTFLIRQFGLDEQVELLGACTEAEVIRELGAADALLLPSLSEGISNAVLEAMAAGRPVIATDCGGMTEVVTDGVDGLVVPVGDADAMADRLAELAADPALRRRLADSAAATADRDLDVSRQVAVFIEAYRRLVGR